MRLQAALLSLLLSLGLSASPLHATLVPGVSQQANDGMGPARQALARGDHAAAIQLCEAAVDQDPDKGVAWLLLGQALQLAGRWEDALGALGLAAESSAQAAEANLFACLISAEQGLQAEALELAIAASQAGLPPRRLWAAPQLQALSQSSAFQQAVPKPKESAECFVEDVRILHTFYGEKPGDTYGWIGRDCGDVDADGKSDLLISAPYSNEGGAGAGKIYVYSGQSGELLFSKTGSTGQGLGMGIEAAGDLNGDGFGDVFAGAPSSGAGAGSAYVYSGKDGSVLHAFTRGEANDLFGRKGMGGVDFDADGVPDLLIGAPGAGANKQGPGHAYLYSGKTGLELARVSGEQAGDAFGTGNAVWAKGDLKLLAIGAGRAGKSRTGRVYVYRWKASRLELAFTIESDATGTALGGMFVCFPGDMDGDGVSEVYASDWQNAAKGSSTGRVYLHSGKSGERLFTLTGERAGEGFGTCTADVGDVDGDGVADLLVGAWQESSAARGGGKCTLYSMKDQSVLATYTCNVPGETLGFDTTGVGDLDGDGGIDFLVTNGYSNVMGARAGRAFVIAGPVPKK